MKMRKKKPKRDLDATYLICYTIYSYIDNAISKVRMKNIKVVVTAGEKLGEKKKKKI